MWEPEEDIIYPPIARPELKPRQNGTEPRLHLLLPYNTSGQFCIDFRSVRKIEIQCITHVFEVDKSFVSYGTCLTTSAQNTLTHTHTPCAAVATGSCCRSVDICYNEAETYSWFTRGLQHLCRSETPSYDGKYHPH